MNVSKLSKLLSSYLKNQQDIRFLFRKQFSSSGRKMGHIPVLESVNDQKRNEDDYRASNLG